MVYCCEHTYCIVVNCTCSLSLDALTMITQTVFNMSSGLLVFIFSGCYLLINFFPNNRPLYGFLTARPSYYRLFLTLEIFSIAFTANGKRQAEISRLPKTREIYLVSAYILPVSHSFGASTKNREIS